MSTGKTKNLKLLIKYINLITTIKNSLLMPKHYFSSKTHTTSSAVWKPNTAVQQGFFKNSAWVKRNLIFLLPFTHSWHATAPLKIHKCIRYVRQDVIKVISLKRCLYRSNKMSANFCIWLFCLTYSVERPCTIN